MPASRNLDAADASADERAGLDLDLGLEPASRRAPALAQLKDRIRAIERSPAAAARRLPHPSCGNGLPPPQSTLRPTAAWTLGAAALEVGLETGGVHEIKPVHAGADWASAWAAARSFALALAGRRLAGRPDKQHADVLWCTSAAMTAELGALYGPGLAALGLDPARLIVVEAARQPDALWALEQGLKSGSLALAAALIDDVGLTPARRLALAAAASDTPCLLLTHPRGAVTAATATRWRIGPAPSAPHPFDIGAPGAARFTVALERCRARPPSACAEPVLLEWCDAAYHFRVVAAVADRADEAGRSARQRHAGTSP